MWTTVRLLCVSVAILFQWFNKLQLEFKKPRSFLCSVQPPFWKRTRPQKWFICELMIRYIPSTNIRFVIVVVVVVFFFFTERANQTALAQLSQGILIKRSEDHFLAYEVLNFVVNQQCGADVYWSHLRFTNVRLLMGIRDLKGTVSRYF